MPTYESIPGSRGERGPRLGCVGLFFVVLLLVFTAQSVARLIIEYSWWSELGQRETWQSILIYSVAPVAMASFVVFAMLWLVHARALKFAGTRLRQNRLYALASTAVLAFVAVVIARANLDPWTTVSFWGSQRAGVPPDVWRDPIFGNALPFYLFELPFYQQLAGLVAAAAIVAAVVFYVSARAWQLVGQSNRFRNPSGITLEFEDLRLGGAMESILIRVLLVIALLAFAAQAFLSRYELLFADHGFLVGVDYLAHTFGLPLQWAVVVACLAGVVFVLIGRWRWLALIPFVLVVRAILPSIVSAVYVKPNELGLQKPYIDRHIAATRSAFGLKEQLQEIQFPASLEKPINFTDVRPLLENVRLWDWRAFHDTVTQVQALRQYYAFADSDVDRYMIDGQIRQVLLTPRELDIRQLPDARSNWINTRLIYTHGYGIVMADANRISPNGQPLLFVQDAPPKISTKSLQLTRPEIYYGEVTHEPVFVDTGQPEFNYPAGADNVQTRYQGRGGIPIGSFGMRLTAAIATADRNLLLSGYINDRSRMMIRRNVRDRVNTLADFIEWDPDPYLVVTKEGRLVWILDGFTTSDRHPYSRRIRLGNNDVSYMRNAVKATVDAYDGSVRLYVFAPEDPIVRAFSAMFPDLFVPADQMPAGLREHVRYPELLFRAQAEIYRTFHMQDPESFYNREDLWDVAREIYGQNAQPEPVQPTFVIATVPGSDKPEFLLVQPFTPRNKDNLIGLMMARSDGEHLGEVIVLQLSKQSLIYGPLQVEARVSSDQNISKDLSLWNQQGSQVLRGQMLVLPAQETFIYIEPIYIQASQARMPQMKKVVVAMGNTLIYRDTYEQALSELAGTPLEAGQISAVPPASETGPGPSQAQGPGGPPPPVVPVTDVSKLQTAREHLRRYRELSSQGRWSEAGRELEALDRLLVQ